MITLTSLGDILSLERRPIDVNPEAEYAEIGIRSFGKGIFHKAPRTGIEVGEKQLYLVKDGDFILQITFAWEGAIGLASQAEDGMYCSTRFPTFRVDQSKCHPPYLVYYFRTPEGVSQLGKISPGTAGRNRVLSLKRVPEVVVPLPPLDEQQRIVAHIDAIAEQFAVARGLRHGAVEEAEAFVVAEQSAIYGVLLRRSIRRLDEVSILERGKFSFRPRNDPRFFGGEHPWIQIGEIQASDKYIRTYTATLNDQGLAISRKFPKGTLLISIAATIGAVGILDFDCCVPDSIVAVTPQDSYESEFIYYLTLRNGLS